MWKFLWAAMLVPVLAGCAGTPRVQALHSPLYRAENHNSSIVVQATETRDGIAEIRIEAVVGELTACENLGWPSLIPCRRNASAVGLVCTFPSVKTQVTCTLPIAISPQRLVTYTATTRSTANRTASSGPVTYAGGAPLTQVTVQLPFVTITMPWETARPVIWRTDSPSSGTERGDKIDLGLVPDADMPSYRAFTDDLDPMIRQLFYTDSNAFSAWTRTWRNIFNVWAGPAGADGEGCTRNFSGGATNVKAAFDGTAILHRNAFRDCASISLGGGSGTAQTNLGDATWVLLHESGHFLFGLGDEYVGGGNFSISTPLNIYASKASCESNSQSNSLPTSQCVQIGTSGTWRNDDGQSTTMEDRTLSSDWRTMSGKALGNHLSRCLNGACY